MVGRRRRGAGLSAEGGSVVSKADTCIPLGICTVAATMVSGGCAQNGGYFVAIAAALVAAGLALFLVVEYKR